MLDPTHNIDWRKFIATIEKKVDYLKKRKKKWSKDPSPIFIGCQPGKFLVKVTFKFVYNLCLIIFRNVEGYAMSEGQWWSGNIC